MEKLKSGILISKALFRYKPTASGAIQASGNTSFTLTTRTTTNCYVEQLRIRNKHSR